MRIANQRRHLFDARFQRDAIEASSRYITLHESEFSIFGACIAENVKQTWAPQEGPTVKAT